MFERRFLGLVTPALRQVVGSRHLTVIQWTPMQLTASGQRDVHTRHSFLLVPGKATHVVKRWELTPLPRPKFNR